VQKCEGEAVANNRKGKLIFFYEWDIVLNWAGTLKGGEQEAEGTINIPNLSEENDVSEIDVSLHLSVMFADWYVL
jgi:activator of HSP90 ATPase